MEDRTQTPKPRPHHPFRSLIAWMAILGLAALVAWLASERNARQWFLVPEDAQLVVKRGLPLPAGRARFKTDDPALAQTYAPIKVPAGGPPPQEQSFDDRAALDQALFDLLSRWARADIATEKPELLERGLAYVSRAERLAGISAAQREDLRALRAESALFESAWLLERGAEDLRLAREKLRLAADAPGRYSGEALLLLRRIEPLVEEALTASRQAAQRPQKKEPPPAPPPSAPEGGSR